MPNEGDAVSDKFEICGGIFAYHSRWRLWPSIILTYSWYIYNLHVFCQSFGLEILRTWCDIYVYTWRIHAWIHFRWVVLQRSDFVMVVTIPFDIHFVHVGHFCMIRRTLSHIIIDIWYAYCRLPRKCTQDINELWDIEIRTGMDGMIVL